MKQFLSLFLLSIVLCGPFRQAYGQNHPTVLGHTLQHRFVRISTNFLVNDRLEDALEVLTTAESVCYNGIILSDVKFGFLDAMPTAYFDNLHVFLDSAAALGMRVIPETAYFGYSQPILFHNPNLAASLRVFNAPFVVQNIGGIDLLRNLENDTLPLMNGGFEEVPTTSNEFPQWNWQDNPGLVSFWDTTVSRSGNASARISDPNGNQYGNGRITQYVSVTPFRDYRINFWVKTENLAGGNTDVYIVNRANNRVLNFNAFEVNSTQAWTEYNLTFNTLDAIEVEIFWGIWGGSTGDLWIDDIKISATQLNNIVRRNGTPVSLSDWNGSSLIEGIDVDSLIDPLLGIEPFGGAYSIWHDQPEIGIPAGSSLQAGDTILISYYHAGIVEDGQVGAALTEPEAIQITEQQMIDVKGEFETAGVFEGWMFSHDEIRVHGWDQSPSFGSAGADLAWNINEVYQAAEMIDSSAFLTVWSDMFDPYHNAYYDPSDPYYLVNGMWYESWLGLPSEVHVINWNYFSNRMASAQFFSAMGHAQILAGYYDEPSYYTLDWLSELQGINVKGVEGVMFTTWIDDFTNMEHWAETVFGGCSFATNLGEENPMNSIKVFPNPTYGRLTIEMPTEMSILTTDILDAMGRRVDSRSGNLRELDLSFLQDGVYLLDLSTTSGRYAQMIIIR